MNELFDSIMGNVEENTLGLSIEDAIDVLNDVIGQCIARVEDAIDVLNDVIGQCIARVEGLESDLE